MVDQNLIFFIDILEKFLSSSQTVLNNVMLIFIQIWENAYQVLSYLSRKISGRFAFFSCTVTSSFVFNIRVGQWLLLCVRLCYLYGSLGEQEFHWLLLSPSKCTVTCGRGLRYRVVLCINHRGQHVGGCNPQLKLHIKEECIIPVPCYKPKGGFVVKVKSGGVSQLFFQYHAVYIPTY